MQIFKKESVSNYLEADSRLSKSLTTKDLIGLGIGAVIGTGIFILPGHEAASHAGPAVAIAFLMAAIVSGLRLIFLSHANCRISLLIWFRCLW